MADRSKQAVQRFDGDYNCAQSVLSVYASEFGLDEDLAIRLTAPFGGGVGRRGEVCGAVTGALMVLGLKCATARISSEEKERQYALAREFMTAFEEKHGSILCRELLGGRIDTPAQRQKAKDAGLFDRICREVVRDATILVGRMLRARR